MLAARQQTANEYFNLRLGLVERKEDAFASEWRSRYEQLRRAEEAIFDGTSAPNRAIEQLIASKPPNMQNLHFEYALQHLLPKFVFSRKSKSQQNTRRVSTSVESAAPRLYASPRRSLEKKRL